MKGKGLTLFLFLILLTMGQAFTKSLYYYQPFADNTITNDGTWEFDFLIGRNGYQNHQSGGTTGDNNPGRIFVEGGELALHGRGFAGGTEYHNYWLGNAAVFNPVSNATFGQNLTASSDDPMGFVVYRSFANLDPSDGNETFVAYQCSLPIWIAMDNNPDEPWENYEYFVQFIEETKDTWNGNASRFGYYNSSEMFVNLDAISNVEGTTFGTLTGLEWGYDTTDNNNWNDYLTFTTGNGAQNPNNNLLGFKITHDGGKVTFYINPDPDDDHGTWPNEWLKMGESAVGWDSNMIILFGQEALMFHTEAQEANYDNFIMRTVASNITAEITPKQVVVDTNITFKMTVTPEDVSVNDSGIGELYISKPSEFGSWDSTKVWLTNNQEGGLTRVATDPAVDEFYSDVVRMNGEDVLYVRFYMGTSATPGNQIVTNGNIDIYFDLTPSTKSTGATFHVFADCTKHENTYQDWVFDNANGNKYATTGWKKANPASTGATTVEVFTHPMAKARVESSPNPIFEANEVSHFTVKLSTEGFSGGYPDISAMRIHIPDGDFIVSNNNPDLNIESTLLGSARSLNNIFIASNYIYVYYTNLIDAFPGVNGFDKIEFDVYGTPSILKTTNFLWDIEVTSAGIIQGTTWQFATNDTYTNFYQNVAIFTSNAQLECKLSPDKTGVYATISSNQNSYTYTVQNKGKQNDVYALHITVPEDFDIDSVSNVASALGGSALGVYTAERKIYVYYTNINGGAGLTNQQIDEISFVATHTNTDLNMETRSVSFISYASNGNGLGFTEQSEMIGEDWSVRFVPPVPEAENYIVNPYIETTTVTNVITNRIYNVSPKGLPVKMAKLVVPTNYLSVLDVKSKIISDDATYISNVTVGISNIIYIHYLSESTNIPSVYEDLGSQIYDDVVLTLADTIDWNTFPRLRTNIVIPTFVYKTNGETTNTNLFSQSEVDINYTVDKTNDLIIRFPDVIAAFNIEYTGSDQTNTVYTTTVINTNTYTITNLGRTGNLIKRVRIDIDPTVSTNILGFNIPGGGVSTWNDVENRIEINYESNPIDGGEGNTFTFILKDIVDGAQKKNVFFYPYVSNFTIFQQVTNIITGKSGKLDYMVPRPKGGGSIEPTMIYANDSSHSVITQAFTATITNSGYGQDKFYAVQILVPDFIQGMIDEVYSPLMNKDTSSPGIFTINNTNIQVIYSNDNTNLGQGLADELLITAVITNLTTLPSSDVWTFYGNNGLKDGSKSYFLITNIQGNTNTYATERANVTVTGDYLTTETNKTFNFELRNGKSGSKKIKTFRILIPDSFSVDISDVNHVSGFTVPSFDITNGYIWVTYPDGAELPDSSGGGVERMEITASKPITNIAYETDWETHVYYKDEPEIYAYDTIGDSTMSIYFPGANFYAYVKDDDVNVSKDFDSWDYSMTISNVGSLGNNIYNLKIVPPNIITNITSVSSILATTKAWYSNADGCVYVDYYGDGTNVVSGAYDVITFTGFDNQTTPGYSSNWVVLAANYDTNATQTNKNPGIISESLDLNIITPPYSSSFSVSPITRSTVISNNSFDINVANDSDSGNNLESIKLTFNSPFITNGLSGVSSRGATNVLSNNVVTFFYTNTFSAGENDTISITIGDNFENGDTNSSVTMSAQFNSSGVNYIPSNPSGSGNVVQFVMPDPEFYTYLKTEDTEVGKDYSLWEYDLILTNVGSTDNKIYIVRIVPPAVITNATNFSSVPASTMFYSNNSVYVDFGDQGQSISPGEYATITLSGYDDQTNSGYTGSWTAYAANWLTNIPSTETMDPSVLGEILDLNIITPGYNSTYYVLPREVITTAPNQVMSVSLNNTGSSGNNINKVKINFPAPFTNAVILSNSLGAIYSNGMNEVVLEYTNLFAPNSNDVVYVLVDDTMSEGQYTNNITAEMNYSSSADNFIPSSLMSGESDQVIFDMPTVAFKAYVNSGDINIGQDNESWDYEFTVTNTGSISNNIFMVKITPPTTNTDPSLVITNVEILSTLIASDSWYSNNGCIYVNYEVSNEYIPNTGYDKITIRGYDNQGIGGFSANWKIEAVNSTNLTPLVAGTAPSGQSLKLNFVFPGYGSTYYLQTSEISTLLPKSDVKVQINNVGSGNNDIKNVKLYLNSPLITNDISVTSPLLSGYTVSSNYVEVSYNQDVFEPQTNDVITVNIKDEWIYGNTNINITADVKFFTSGGNYISSILSGGNNEIQFNMPEVSYYAYMDSDDTEISKDYQYWDYHLNITNTGGLSNHIYKLKIENPDTNTLTNLVMISNLIPAHAWYSNEIGCMFVDYYVSNQSVSYNAYDRIVIRGYDNEEDGGFSDKWKVYAVNNTNDVPTTESIPSEIGESLDLDIIFPGYGSTYYVQTTSVSTFKTATELSVKINNAGSSGNYLTNSLIYLPGPYITNNLNGTSSLGGSITINEINGSNFVMISYSSTDFPAQTNDVVNLSVSDNWTYGDTNATIVVYNLFDTAAGVYNKASLSGGGRVVEFDMPTTLFYAYVDDSDVSIKKDYDQWVYDLNITNTGALSNNIYKVKIEIPNTNVFTNVQISNYSIAAKWWVSNDGYIYGDYSASNESIKSGESDRISLLAYDNQTQGGFAGEWAVYGVNNTIDPIAISAQTPDAIGESLDCQIYDPGYGSTYYVTPNQLLTIYSSNSISVLINNVGSDSNDILSTRIYFSEPFLTNGIIISNNLNATKNLYVTNGLYCLEMDYPASEFGAFTNDMITLNLRDDITIGSTNISLNVDALYSTSAGKYRSSDLSIGTNIIVFTMPDPVVEAYLVKNEIYTTQTHGNITYRFINKGEGSNNLTRIKLFVPDQFTNGFLLNDSLAESVNYDGTNTYTINYTNFYIGVTNDLDILIDNDQTVSSEYVFESLAYNGSEETNTIEDSGEKTLYVIKPPAAEMVTRTVYSPDYQIPVSLSIVNNISGNLPLQKLSIAIPGAFTNIVLVSNLVADSVISNGTTNATIYYGSNGLAKSESDVITFVLNDKYDLLETNDLQWNVWVNNGTGSDSSAKELYTGALKQNMRIPALDVTNFVPNRLYFIQEGDNIRTNELIMIISNRTDVANNILTNTIELPKELSNIIPGSIQLSYPGASSRLTNDTIEIVYSSGLKGGETNYVTFDFVNKVLSSRSVRVDINGYNGSSSEIDNYNATINFIAAAEPTEAHISYVNEEGVKEVYSIDRTAEIVYKVHNGMYDLVINKLRIGFDTTQIAITGINSSLYGNSVPYTTTSSNLYLDYTSLGGIPTRADATEGNETLTISIAYTNSSNWTNNMRCDVLFEETTVYEAATAPSGESMLLPVLMADFGRISGYVIPGAADPIVKVYYPESVTIMTNKYGGNLVISADSTTGQYFIDFVPSGMITLGFSGTGYRESFISNYNMQAGQTVSMGTNKLRKSPFDPNSGTVQTSVSLDDGVSQIILPGGTIPEYFSLDIWLTNISSIQKTGLNNVSSIDSPNNSSGITIYNFEMFDKDGETLKYEQELNGDSTIQLHYDESEITAQGWTEQSLAIYYWKDSTRKWVRIGGVVDSAQDTVTAKVSYLHKYYVLLGEQQMQTITPGFVSVEVNPKVFTPGSGNSEFENVKISIGFDNTYDTFEFKIYNLSGNLVTSFERDASYAQGEVYWDGKDQDGYYVDPGVYIYQIKVQGNMYSGTVIVAR